jgi:hypothetical protein
MTKRSHRAMSDACVSIVKRRGPLATCRAVVAPEAITKPVILTTGQILTHFKIDS